MTRLKMMRKDNLDLQRRMIIENFLALQKVRINDAEWRCFKYIAKNPGVTTPMIAKRFDICLANAAERAAILFFKRYLSRELVYDGSGGKKFAYWAKVLTHDNK